MKYDGNTKTIAVAGAFPGAGATHLCLCLANYMASKEKKKVILIELRENSCLYDMVKGKTKDLNGVLGYEYMDVVYIPSATKETALRLLRERDEYIIIDMGTDILNYKEVCLNTGRIFVMGSFKSWNMNRYGKFIHSLLLEFDLRKIKFFSIMTDKKECNDFKNRYNKELYSVPIVLNPLCIKSDSFKDLLKVLN